MRMLMKKSSYWGVALARYFCRGPLEQETRDLPPANDSLLFTSVQNKLQEFLFIQRYWRLRRKTEIRYKCSSEVTMCLVNYNCNRSRNDCSDFWLGTETVFWTISAEIKHYQFVQCNKMFSGNSLETTKLRRHFSTSIKALFLSESLYQLKKVNFPR